MPFQSKVQQRYMFAKHPKIARKWADKYGVPENLPEKKVRKGLARLAKRGKK